MTQGPRRDYTDADGNPNPDTDADGNSNSSSGSSLSRTLYYHQPVAGWLWSQCDDHQHEEYNHERMDPDMDFCKGPDNYAALERELYPVGERRNRDQSFLQQGDCPRSYGQSGLQWLLERQQYQSDFLYA